MSAAGHLALALAMLGSATGNLVANPTGAADQGAMTVTLVSSATLSPPATEPSTSVLRPLMARVETGAEPVTFQEAPRNTGMGDMLHRLATAQTSAGAPHRSAERETRLPTQPDRGPDARQARASGNAKSSEGMQTTQSGSSGGLWGAVQPCWERLRPRESVPVTLEFALNERGVLQGPPHILRPNGPTDLSRMQAEAAALSALAKCLPGNELRFAGRTHRLAFP